MCVSERETLLGMMARTGNFQKEDMLSFTRAACEVSEPREQLLPEPAGGACSEGAQRGPGKAVLFPHPWVPGASLVGRAHTQRQAWASSLAS